MAAPVWTANTLQVDCAGHFKLCYELKAGKYVLFCSQHPEEMRLSFKVKK